MRKFWRRFLDYFQTCDGPSGWCPKCRAWVPCQFPIHHKSHYHYHLTDPYGRGHDYRWFNHARSQA